MNHLKFPCPFAHREVMGVSGDRMYASTSAVECGDWYLTNH